MAIFYHLSHFFEFLTSLYFGGFALLGFFQKDATETLEVLISNRKTAALNAKTQVREYFKIAISGQSGPRSALMDSGKWAVWEGVEKFVDKRFAFANNYITTLATEKGIFLKKFFPSFFYAGFFCLSVVLFSGYAEVCKDVKCIDGINHFFFYYCIGSVLFLIWAIIIFPIYVNNRDYLKLILLNVVACLAMTILATIFSHVKDPSYIANLLLPENSDYLIFYVILIALIPLAFVFILVTFILICWVGSNSFYVYTLRKMKDSNNISGDIQGLTKP